MGDITHQLLMEEAGPEDQDIMEGIMASLDDVLMPKNNVMVDQSPLQPQLQKNKECKSKPGQLVDYFRPIYSFLSLSTVISISIDLSTVRLWLTLNV